MPKIFAIYDSKVESYGRPMFFLTKGEALRSWSDIINDDKSAFHKHPEDFTLFELGEFDETSGKIQQLPTPVSLGVAIEFKNAQG